MSLWNSVLVDSDAGVKVIRDVLLPIPTFDIGTLIGYWCHSKADEPFIVEATIVSYNISVFPTGMDDEGNMEYEADIKYFLDNDIDVMEEEIEYSYPEDYSEEAELVSEEQVQSGGA